jgi:hypothetical protein
MTVVSAISHNGFPAFGIYTSQSVHVIVDVVGFIDGGTIPGGLRFRPMTPTRITDTRVGQGSARRAWRGKDRHDCLGAQRDRRAQPRPAPTAQARAACPRPAPRSFTLRKVT